MKPVFISALMLICIAFGIALVPFAEWFDSNFSSPSSVVAGKSPSATIMRVSAYCPCKICCGKWADGYTASGKPAVGLIVAAPQRFPFGTILSIPGYSKRAVIQDRGGAITGNRLDVLFATHEAAKQWGVQYLMVREAK